MNQHMLTPIILLNGNPKASAQIQMELMSMSTTNMENLKEEEKRATINACEIYDFVIQSLPILVWKMKNMAVQIISHFLKLFQMFQNLSKINEIVQICSKLDQTCHIF